MLCQVWALIVGMTSLTNPGVQPDVDSNCSAVTFVTRAEWGARPPKKPPTQIGHPVNMSFIHHSVSPDVCTDEDSCVRATRSIQNFHMDTRDKSITWDDIGYSFLIGGDGRVYEGRGWGVVGAHTYGYNDISHGFCIIGNFTGHLPNGRATNATLHVLKCGVEKGHVIPAYELFGHRDAGCTECPGNALYDLIHRWLNFSTRKIPKRCPKL